MTMRSLVRHRNADPGVTSLQAAMNSLFEDFTGGFLTAPPVAALEAFTPRIDLTEDEKSVRITAELPGIDEKDVDVSLANGVLTLRGEKRDEREEKGRNWYRCERSYGSFQRAIPLPCEVDPEKVEAAASKGVLTVTLAKSGAERARSRRIPVKSA